MGKLRKEMLSSCGLVCHTCPIYLATREKDKEEQLRMRADIARLCNERYGMKYEAKNITDCDGCRAEGKRLFIGSQSCAIRKCVRQKGLVTCAQCADYVCEKLAAFYATDPEAKARLNERRGRSS